jgi:hypothetical protein
MSSILFALGIVSSVMILLIFTRREFRQAPSTIYILNKAIYDMISLLFLVLFRAYTGATGIDPSRTNEIWCKLRTSLLFVTAFGSFSCICLTGFDQWMTTSRSVQRRQWSSKKVAYYAILIIFIISFVFVGTPLFIMTAPVGTPAVCSYVNLSYADFFSFFFAPIVFGVLPIVIPAIFGILTCRNIRLFLRRVSRIEQQLTRMLLLQLMSLSIGSIPYAVYYFYVASTRRMIKSTLRIAEENLYMAITRNFFQVNFVYSFYIFLISSGEIRRICKNLILRFIHRQQIAPTITRRTIDQRRRPNENIIVLKTIHRMPVVT